MKKAILITTGTLAGLGAVLSITPPQISAAPSHVDLGTSTPTDATSVATPTPDATTASAAPRSQASTTPSATASAPVVVTPTPTPTKAAASGASGTFTGAGYSARQYGTVLTTATFSDGKLSSVSASQSPSSWSQQSLSVLIPWVNAGNITIEQVKQYSSAQLPCSTSNSCNSRASYTADAFWSSLKSAIEKAGL